MKDDKAQITVDPQGTLPRYMGVDVYTMEKMKNDADYLMKSYEEFLSTYQDF